MPLKKLFDITNKQEVFAIGIMSGTSCDGVDVSLCKIIGNGYKTKIKELGSLLYPFPSGLKEFILRNSLDNNSSISEISTLNVLLANIYNDAIKALCQKLRFDLSTIDFIGSHGQTIHHLPQKKNYFGYNIKSTMQVGDPSVLAKLTNQIVVGDFRLADMALGGEGAPLVPYFDDVLFSKPEETVVLINIGGISNISVLPKMNMADRKVLAFDTGPGNMLIDLMMQKYFDLDYDCDGKKAAAGHVIPQFQEELLKSDAFVKTVPPKSTGREYYNIAFLERILERYQLSKEDIMANLTYYTAYSIGYSIKKFVLPSYSDIKNIMISGGGSNNPMILRFLRAILQNVKIEKFKCEMFSSDSKEAVCFAFLANETLHGNSGNLPEVTNANQKTILGKICLP